MVKQVKILPRQEVKKTFLLDLINELKTGKTPAQIAKEKMISKQKLQYYIRELREKGAIKKIGYGVWEVKTSTKDTIIQQVKEVRGHAFMWKIKIPKIRNWDKRQEILSKNNIKFKLIGLRDTPRIIIKDRKIWLGSKHIIIYEPRSFIANNAIESRKLAFYNVLILLDEIEIKLKVSFKINGCYEIKVRREHYALMKNCLAIQCNKEGAKLEVKNKDGSTWFIIDNSYNLNEAETIHTDTALTDNIGVQKYFNSHKATNFKVTPEYVINTMNGIQQNQMLYAENISSHIKAIQDLGKGVNELTQLVKKIKNGV